MGMRPYLLIILTAGLVLACSVPVLVTAESAGNLLAKGNELLDEGKYQDAILAFNGSISADPKQARAWAGIGFAYNGLKEYESALPAFDTALSISPNYGKAMYEKGNALYGLKRYDEAITAYDEAAKIYPEFAYLAYYGKAKSLQGLGKYNDALTFYDKALAFKQDYAPAYNYKGETLAALGKTEEAIAAFDKALVLAPTMAVAAQNKANLTKQNVPEVPTGAVYSPAVTMAKEGVPVGILDTPAATNPPVTKPAATPTKKSPFPGIIVTCGVVLAAAGLVALKRRGTT